MLNLHSIYFGQKHPDFDYKDMDIIKRVKRLARKHHRQCENDCNGEGWIGSNFYRCDSKEGYLADGETTVFSHAIFGIEDKLKMVLYAKDTRFSLEFQHDPRGSTVKLYYEGDYVDLS